MSHKTEVTIWCNICGNEVVGGTKEDVYIDHTKYPQATLAKAREEAALIGWVVGVGDDQDFCPNHVTDCQRNESHIGPIVPDGLSNILSSWCLFS